MFLDSRGGCFVLGRDIPLKGGLFYRGGGRIMSAPIVLPDAVVGDGNVPSVATLWARSPVSRGTSTRQRWLSAVDTSLVSQIYALIFLH